MTEHDHINTADNHTQNDRSADYERDSAAGPTSVARLKPALVLTCEACGERSAPHVRPDSVEICKCCGGVRRGDVMHREEHSRPLSNELERPTIGSTEEH